MTDIDTAELSRVPALATRTAAELEAQAFGALEVAQAYVIDSADMYALAGEELTNIATRRKRLEEARLSITRPMDAAKRAVMDLFAKPLATLESAEGMLRQGMLTWKRAEDERVRKARELAEAAERQRQAELEEQRRQAEAAEAEERRKAQAALQAGDTEAFTAAAQAAEEAAAVREAAEEAAEEAAVAPPPMVATNTAKAAGVSSRSTWKAEVVDLNALITAAAAGLAKGDSTLAAYLLPNTQALGMVAKGMKAAARIPGVRVYAEEGLAVRRK